MAKFLDKAGLKHALSGFWTGAKAYADEVSRVAAAAATELNNKIGELSSLTTAAKNNIVAAVNELKSGKADKATTLAGYGITDALSSSLKGKANGLAELGSDGKVPSSQLPSYVDDVLEYAKLSAFPTTGETGKIYIAQDTNLTYRWSGTAYVEISQSLALGETSSTAYAGDKGKANATAIATHKADKNNPHAVTASQVGLGSVVNTGDSATPVSGGTTKFTTGGAYTELEKKVDKVSGSSLVANTKVAAYDTHIASTSNPHSVTAAQVGLGNVANTGDSATPVEGGTTKFTTGGAYTLLAKKVDKVTGMSLSHNDLTDTLKSGYDDAVTKKHEHSNKSVLDGITADKVSTWDAATSDSALSDSEIDAVIAEIFPAA